MRTNHWPSIDHMADDQWEGCDRTVSHHVSSGDQSFTAKSQRRRGSMDQVKGQLKRVEFKTYDGVQQCSKPTSCAPKGKKIHQNKAANGSTQIIRWTSASTGEAS